MAESEGCSEEEMQKLLKQRYDGYHFSKVAIDIYNPFSVLNAFYNKDIRDYWFASGTPTYLIRLMNHFDEGIDRLTGKYYALDEFVNYKADAEYPLPMIYQSEGRVDCIVETPKFVYIFEFKLDGSLAEALRQIEERGYARPYESDERIAHKIGVNFSSKTGTIDDYEIR